MAPLEELHKSPSSNVAIQIERDVKKCDKESMKTAILKQEATFREQVRELHRLYRVQQELMRNVTSTQHNLEQRNVHNRINSCQPNHCYKDKGYDGGEALLESEQDTDLELTLATGCRRRKRERAPYTSYSGTSFSSSSSESGGSKLVGNDCGPLRVPDSQTHVSIDRKGLLDLEDANRMERVQPSWMHPCLSLRMA